MQARGIHGSDPLITHRKIIGAGIGDVAGNDWVSHIKQHNPDWDTGHLLLARFNYIKIVVPFANVSIMFHGCISFLRPGRHGRSIKGSLSPLRREIFHIAIL